MPEQREGGTRALVSPHGPVVLGRYLLDELCPQFLNGPKSKGTLADRAHVCFAPNLRLAWINSSPHSDS